MFSGKGNVSGMSLLLASPSYNTMAPSSVQHLARVQVQFLDLNLTGTLGASVSAAKSKIFKTFLLNAFAWHWLINLYRF